MKNREIYFLIISTFIVVLAWIAFNLYHNMKTSTIPPNLTVQILPITPNFDSDTINKLKKRDKTQPLFELVPPTPSIEPEVKISTQEGATQ